MTQQCSVDRFEHLTDKHSAVDAIRTAARDADSRLGFRVSLPARGSDVPRLPPNVFKYDDQIGPYRRLLDDGEDVRVVLATKGQDVLGFGLAIKEEGKPYFEIDIIDVRKSSRRSTGMKLDIRLEGQAFDVGIAHAMVCRLIDELSPNTMRTRAMPESWYTFKSLGFSKYFDGDDEMLELTPT